MTNHIEKAPFPESQSALEPQKAEDPVAFAKRCKELQAHHELTKRYGGDFIERLQAAHPGLTVEEILEEIGAHGF